MNAIEKFLNSRPSKHIFHYTNAMGAIGIIEQHCLWASHIRHLNDGTEFVHAKEWLTKELKKRNKGAISRALQNALNTMEGSHNSEILDPYAVGRVAFQFTGDISVFVISFSEEEDLLSQWRAYGSGYSLGFDLSNYTGNPLDGLSLVKCVYTKDDREQLCTNVVESWKDRDAQGAVDLRAMVADCIQIMAAVKDAGFAQEKEWRLVGNASQLKHRFRPGRHGIVPFVEMPVAPKSGLLKTIWVGPNTEGNIATDAFVQLASSSGFDSLQYQLSSIPFRG